MAIYQVPLCDNDGMANGQFAGLFTARPDLGPLPTANDGSQPIDTVELLNETGDFSKCQKYLDRAARCVNAAPDGTGARVIEFCLWWKRKKSSKLIFLIDTPGIKFHFLLPGGGPCWVGNPSGGPNYGIWPQWSFAQTCRIWNTGHATLENASFGLIAPYPSGLAVGQYGELLIDGGDFTSPGHLWVMVDPAA